MASAALRRAGEAGADLAALGKQMAEAREGRRLPARRFRVEGSRVGNSALVNEKGAHALRRQYGGSVVEAVEAASFYARHFAVGVACPKKSCAAPAGACCRDTEERPTLVHKKRVHAWEHKDDAPPEPGTEPAKKLKPRDRACPSCQAPPGIDCMNRWGAPRSGYHESRRADAQAATAAAGAAAPAVEAGRTLPSPPAADAARFVAAATVRPEPIDVRCPNSQCRAEPGKPCTSLGLAVSTHKPRIYAADPTKSPEVKREPSLRVSCPTCHSPAFARCVTAAKKFTAAHAARADAWLAQEERGR